MSLAVLYVDTGRLERLAGRGGRLAIGSTTWVTLGTADGLAVAEAGTETVIGLDVLAMVTAADFFLLRDRSVTIIHYHSEC